VVYMGDTVAISWRTHGIIALTGHRSRHTALVAVGKALPVFPNLASRGRGAMPDPARRSKATTSKGIRDAISRDRILCCAGH
jgi:hypothetical protein